MLLVAPIRRPNGVFCARG